MDKIFMLIILLIIGFWGYLKYSEDSGNWVALHNDSIIGGTVLTPNVLMM